MRARRSAWSGALFCLAAWLPSIAPAAVAADWPFWGGDLHNTHHATSETAISPSNVGSLELDWTYDAGGDVSSIPTVAGDVMYFTDWGPELGGLLAQPAVPGGRLHAVNRITGQPLWTRHISEYGAGLYTNISRSSPAVSGDLIIIGDMLNQVLVVGLSFLAKDETRHALGFPDFGKATIYAINRHTGELVWKQKIDDHNMSTVTQSPIVYNDTVLVGVSSQEITIAKDKNYACCNFRGSMVALDLHTGAIKWKTYTVPDNGGATDQFSGASVWGSTAVVDAERNRVIFGSGNNYTAPSSTRDCIRLAGVDEGAQRACQQKNPDNLFDSIIALNLDTGAVEWSFTPLSYDAYNTGCNDPSYIAFLGKGNANCPDPKGPDTDFGQGPIFLTVDVNGERQDRIVAAKKDGMLYMLDAQDGHKIWERRVGPTGLLGGMELGSASDGKAIYLANSNSIHTVYELTAGVGAGLKTTGGFWAAYDVVTGDLLWQTPVPSADLPLTNACTPDNVKRYGFEVCLHVVWGKNRGPGFFAWPIGPVTVANGVVYAGVADLEGNVVAMDAATGKILWQYRTGASVNTAPTVVDGHVYVGSGYKIGKSSKGGRNLFAFKLPGRP
jgi:polyvinyl alcohol dehydrogenase (cytochrome)